MENEHSRGPQPELESEPGRSANPEDKAWPVHIDVYLDNDTTSPPEFRVESSMPSYTEQGQNKKIIKFENNNRPGFKIHFHLHDKTGQGYEFVRNADDAVWSKIGKTCPQSEVQEVFEPRRTKSDGTFGVPMLVVYYPNENNIGRFQYTLNVVKPGSTTPLQLDPGGDGLNGPRTLR
jgi:hypothetical protein